MKTVSSQVAITTTTGFDTVAGINDNEPTALQISFIDQHVQVKYLKYTLST